MINKRSKRSESPDEVGEESQSPTKPAVKAVPFPEKVLFPKSALKATATDIFLQPAVAEERNGEIEFRVVNNDNQRESLIILTGLKCIFQKQLPKMPKDYIARLVYDRTHLSMAIVKKPLEVVG